jgi:DNA-binding XRE family transcriptional regulator
MNRRPNFLTRLGNREYREALVSSFINSTIAYQIRGLRKKKQLDQSSLGELTGMKQTAISRLENPDYGNLSVNTLKRIARAFDVALIVRFAPYSELVRWRSTMSQADMAPPSFDQDADMSSNATEAFGGNTSIAAHTIRSRVRSRHLTSESTAGQLALEFDVEPMPSAIIWEATTTELARSA